MVINSIAKEQNESMFYWQKTTSSKCLPFIENLISTKFSNIKTTHELWKIEKASFCKENQMPRFVFCDCVCNTVSWAQCRDWSPLAMEPIAQLHINYITERVEIGTSTGKQEMDNNKRNIYNEKVQVS